MAGLANERVIYLNGEIVPESQAVISVHDRGFKFGDAAFDTTRTFGHRIFKLKEHIDRFYRSLKYLRLDPGMTRDEMAAVSRDVLARNLHLLDADEDYWVSQRVTRGEEVVGGDLSEHGRPTVIVECVPLPLKARAQLFRDGIRVVVPHVRRVSPDALSPRAKTHNYLNLINGDLEVKALDPGAWAVLLDEHGNLSEGVGCNFFMVEGGRLVTPRAKYVLPGISRQTVMELAAEEGIPVEERDIDLFDACNADEAFLTSTSLCVCPVNCINGHAMGAGGIPGPVTRRLTDAYIRLVGHDFVQQYLSRL
jgi:branched-chain amino acid aminotransferase